MNNIAKLIKSKTISFNEVLIKNYVNLNLNETEAMILMILYNLQDDGNSYLSIKQLVSKVTLSEETLSDYVMLLVQKGMIEILIDEEGKETFNLDQIIDKLGSLLNNEKKDEYDQKVLLNEIISFVEKMFVKPLAPSDLMIINDWINSGYELDDIKKAVLETVKMNKQTLRYTDAILVNKEKAKRTPCTQDPKIKELIDSIYVKR